MNSGDGRLGIGSNAPSYTLDVNATGSTISSAFRTDQSENWVALKDSGTTIGHVRLGSASGAMLFYAGNSERGRFDSSGRFLVGTSSSRVIGNAGGFASSVQIETTSYAGLSLVQNSNDGTGVLLALGKSRGTSIGSATVVQSGDTLGEIRFSGADGSATTSVFAAIAAQVDATPGANDFPGRLTFSTTADGASSPTARASILNTGELRLGTTENATVSTDPVHTLGNVSIATVQTNLARLIIQDRSANWISFKAGNGVHNGTIAVSGAGVSYGSNSDYRLKENVEPLTGASQKIQLLKPSSYNYIAYPDFRVSGFIAHELQEVVPEAVCGEKDATDEEGNPEHQTVDLSKVVPLLTAALQETITELQTLKARVAALEAS
jgi:hypothetical protein